MSELKTTMDNILKTVQSYRDDVAELTSRMEAVEAGKDRPRGPGVPTTPPATFYDLKSGKPVHTLGHQQKLADLTEKKTGVTLGRWLRGVLLGDKADDHRELADELKSLATTPDASGGYTVPAPLAAEFIDNLRARMVLSQAGARTVPMSSETLRIAKVTADPTFTWHIENASLSASDPTLGAATLKSNTVVGLVKFSLELAQDSVNIEQILSQVLAQGAATAIDAAGLAGTGQVTSPVGHSPTGVASFSGRNTVTSVGVPSSYSFVADAITKLLTANVPYDRVGALIYHPYLWSKFNKLVTGISGDKTTLPLPAYMQGRQQLVTTSAPITGSPTTTTAFIGDWGDLLFGVRQQVSIQFLREAFLGSNLQIGALVYARVDFQPARAASFTTMEGITVGSG
jgi:HK97 family phage major capsid protein